MKGGPAREWQPGAKRWAGAVRKWLAVNMGSVDVARGKNHVD
jgi:hypothetical protein